jgi:hypothetical protein
MRLAGLAGLVGGALSMACGEYISVASQKDAEMVGAVFVCVCGVCVCALWFCLYVCVVFVCGFVCMVLGG